MKEMRVWMDATSGPRRGGRAFRTLLKKREKFIVYESFVSYPPLQD